MKDFLENLAVKALGLVETVKPRLASLFEPAEPAIDSFYWTGAARPENADDWAVDSTT